MIFFFFSVFQDRVCFSVALESVLELALVMALQALVMALHALVMEKLPTDVLHLQPCLK